MLACVSVQRPQGEPNPEQAGMKLRKVPTRPAWKPLYDASTVRIASWSRFLSEAYWNVSMDEAN